MKAGYIPVQELEESYPSYFGRIARFIRESSLRPGITYADIGHKNAKMDYIQAQLDIKVDQVEVGDLNYPFHSKSYDIIFCFEIIEHLANQLTLVESLKSMMTDDGVIFLSAPARPRFLWTEHHFHEPGRDRLERWILKPLGLEIVRHERLRIPHGIGFYFKGFRAFLRLFYNFTNLYEIRHAKTHR